MKWLYIIILVTSSNIVFTSYCQAQTLMRVLIITGGHDFEREAFFDIFDNIPDVVYQELVHPEANQIFDSNLIDNFDVLIFYDMVQEIDDTQKAAFIKVLKEGKGLVFLHHSLVSYQEWMNLRR
jgi:hypothetical protein